MTPTHLYKYRSINKDTLLNLTNHQLWFPKPCEIDDPYDCAIHIERKDINDDESEEIFNLWKDNKLPIKDFNIFEKTHSPISEIKEKFVDGVVKIGKSEFSRQRENIINGWGIACFSELYDDQNMWALYADKHRGMCLEFDCNNYFFRDPFQVNYKPEIPTISVAEVLKNGAKGSLTLLVTTKAECWAYQKEFRLFTKNGNKNYEYEPNALTGVYFGVKTPESDKELIFRILGKTFNNYYVMEKNEDIYKLERRLIKL